MTARFHSPSTEPAPRTGYMGIFKTLGKIAGGVGDVVKVASPLASFIPGVGPLAAAGIGAASGALGKLNDKHATLGNTLGSMAGGAAFGGLGGAGVDALQKGGISGLTGAIGGLGRTSGTAAGVAGGAGQSGSGLLGSILDFLKKNPALVLGGAGLLNSAHQQSGADDSRNQAIGLLQTDMQRRQPLFDALLKRLSEGAPPAQTFGYRDPGNPYTASYR